MNHRIVQLGASAALLVALIGCSAQEAPLPQAPGDLGGPALADPSTSAAPPATEPQCAYSPTAVDHMLATGQPLPRCVREALADVDDAPRGGPGQP